MSFQLIVVLAIVGVAVFFAVSSVLKKRAAFSTKGKCKDDCGCGKGS